MYYKAHIPVFTGGVIIPENSDLNSPDFLKAGAYRTASRPATQSLTNCPANAVFLMHVEHITIDDGGWEYYHREIIEATGTIPIYHQFCTYQKSTDAYTYGAWKKVVFE